MSNKISVITLLTLFGAIGGQSSRFHLVGFEDERITAMAVHPTKDSILYVGTCCDYSGGNLFRTTDGGATWDTIMVGDVPEVYAKKNEIVLHPFHPDTVYVALHSFVFEYYTYPGRVMRTTDGGSTWTRADSGIHLDLDTEVWELAIHPVTPETLYAGTAGNHGGNLFRSFNGGQSWTEIDTGRVDEGIGLYSGVIEIAIDPLHPSTVLAGVSWTGEIYKTMDAGSTWVALNTPWGEGHGLPSSIAINPYQTNIIYAGVYKYGLMKTVDGGLTWSHQDSGITDDRFTAIVIDELDPNHLYSGVFEYGVFETADGGARWMESNAGLENLWVTSLVLTQQALYAGTFEGLYKVEHTTALEEEESIQFEQFHLGYNYPNPFNSETTIPFHVPQSSWLSLTIYNIQGEMIKLLVSGYHASGMYETKWNGTNGQGVTVGTGLYLYQLSTPFQTVARKIVYLK